MEVGPARDNDLVQRKDVAGAECRLPGECLTFVWLEGAGCPQVLEPVDELRFNPPHS
jgi:hypothetical protein